jgi:hypothetical protein
MQPTSAPVVYRVKMSPWARARTAALIAAAFLGGYALARGLDHRDWNLSTQWTKITTIEDVASGVRTVIQEQSGLTESRTAPGPNTPGADLFGGGDQ